MQKPVALWTGQDRHSTPEPQREDQKTSSYEDGRPRTVTPIVPRPLLGFRWGVVVCCMSKVRIPCGGYVNTQRYCCITFCYAVIPFIASPALTVSKAEATAVTSPLTGAQSCLTAGDVTDIGMQENRNGEACTTNHHLTTLPQSNHGSLQPLDQMDIVPPSEDSNSQDSGDFTNDNRHMFNQNNQLGLQVGRLKTFPWRRSISTITSTGSGMAMVLLKTQLNVGLVPALDFREGLEEDGKRKAEEFGNVREWNSSAHQNE
ncbi:unnamed protein product [Ranitomeya imitator]|uniref:Uncharacterized protein n=1 Tax=Ranitomeya imitator TaxID=111125 RepID=A0ABN9LBF0_9NEOB|nr:unnamed protein product [Ranitomeya imitator]